MMNLLVYIKSIKVNVFWFFLIIILLLQNIFLIITLKDNNDKIKYHFELILW